jgi:hypothetical protein
MCDINPLAIILRIIAARTYEDYSFCSASGGDHGRFVSVPQNWRLFRDEKLCYLNPLARILRN